MAKQISKADSQYRRILHTEGVDRVSARRGMIEASVSKGSSSSRGLIGRAVSSINYFGNKAQPVIKKHKVYKSGAPAGSYYKKPYVASSAQSKQYKEYQAMVERRKARAPLQLSVSQQARLHEYHLRSDASRLPSSVRGVEFAARAHEDFVKSKGLY